MGLLRERRHLRPRVLRARVQVRQRRAQQHLSAEANCSRSWRGDDCRGTRGYLGRRDARCDADVMRWYNRTTYFVDYSFVFADGRTRVESMLKFSIPMSNDKYCVLFRYLISKMFVS